MSTLIPYDLTCEHLKNPLAVDESRPRLSWKLRSAKVDLKDAQQVAYRILVASTQELLNRDEGDLWDSRQTRSDETRLIDFAGKELNSFQECFWKVQVWDQLNRPSAWSYIAKWTVGARQSGWATSLNWDSAPDANRQTSAAWVGAPVGTLFDELKSLPTTVVRKSFEVAGTIRRAMLYASALGVYQAEINGRRVGDQELAPEWTDYAKRVQYQAYDVTSLLKSGANAIGATLGAGWYAGQVGLGQMFVGVARGHYGRQLRFAALLMIETETSRQFVGTDASWQYTTDGPIRFSDILAGENYDARMELSGWSTAEFDASQFKPVGVVAGPVLVPQANEPIRITRYFEPKSISARGERTYIVDFGQNVVGWVRLSLTQPRNTRIRLRHAEVLNADGSIYRDNLRLSDPENPHAGAQQEDVYICRGGEKEVFEPRFTYHGFRYVEVTGLDAPLHVSEIEARAVHSASPDTGALETSSPMLNNIVQAIQWTQRGNLMSVPTDCPQRDERLGWMGDIQVFCQTAMFNMDMAGFFTKWLQDVRDAQADDGRLPDFAPQPFHPNVRFSGNPGWGDAGVMVPWKAYVNYGDKRLLEASYESARRYIDWSHENNPSLIWSNRSQLSPLWYGDWLNADSFANLPNFPAGKAEADKSLYSTAFFAASTEIVSRMARVLGHTDDAQRYGKLAIDIREAFNRAFVSSDSTILGDRQSVYALALAFDLLPNGVSETAARKMVDALEPFGGHLSTGIQSTLRMMLELTRWGYTDIAYALMNKTTIPSWGYMVENGGTTIWERWDGFVEGRGYQNPGMNSFNHYAIGAVGEWMYRVIGGLNPDPVAPGWKHFVIRPIPGGGLTWARCAFESPRGRIESNWKLQGNAFELDVLIPPNARATVALPDGTARSVGSGRHQFKST